MVSRYVFNTTPRWLFLVSLVVLLGGLALSTVLRGQTPVPVGPELQVNTNTTGLQVFPAVVSRLSGGFVVVWMNYQPGQIRGQVIGPDGNPIGDEFVVGFRAYPAIARDADDRFLVVWYGSDAVIGRPYDADGVPLGDQFLVETGNNFRFFAFQGPSIAMRNTGEFVVVWARYAQSASQEIYGRRFDAAGSPLAEPFRVNQTTVNYQVAPSVAMDATGAFTVVWTSSLGGFPDRYQTISGRRYDASGTALGEEFKVNSYNPGSPRYPIIRSGPASEFVVVWQNEGADRNIRARRFDADGTPAANDFRVNSSNAGDHTYPGLAIDEGGNFLVAWSSSESSDPNDGSASGVFGRLYDPQGTPLGSEFQVNTYTTGAQERLAVAAMGSGHFVVSWTRFQEGGGNIFAQTLGPPPLACFLPLPSVSDLQLEVVNAGADLQFTWTNVTNPFDYLLVQDLAPQGTFGSLAGSAPNGVTTLTIPMPPGSRFYRVGGEIDDTCACPFLPHGATCSIAADCCSNHCVGPPTNRTCN